MARKHVQGNKASIPALVRESSGPEARLFGARGPGKQLGRFHGRRPKSDVRDTVTLGCLAGSLGRVRLTPTLESQLGKTKQTFERWSVSP